MKCRQQNRSPNSLEVRSIRVSGWASNQRSIRVSGWASNTRENRTMNRTNTRDHERGIALLTVITCLVALMVIAVPFAITMRMGQASRTWDSMRWSSRLRRRWRCST